MEKQKAKILYFKIGRVWCPALGDYVSFDRIENKKIAPSQWSDFYDARHQP